MKYNIDDLIRRLEVERSKGEELLTEKELLSLAMPRINNIDNQIRAVEYGIRRVKEDTALAFTAGNCLTRTEAERFTGISRRTFQRWEKKGLIEIKTRYLSLNELRETLIHIRDNR